MGEMKRFSRDAGFEGLIQAYAMDMKTVISIPNSTYRSAERLATRLGLSRSELYCRALKDLLARHDHALVTAQLNDVYESSATNTGLDVVLAVLQASSIRDKKTRPIEIDVAGERQFQTGRSRSRDRALARLHALKKPMPRGFRSGRD